MNHNGKTSTFIFTIIRWSFWPRNLKSDKKIWEKYSEKMASSLRISFPLVFFSLHFYSLPSFVTTEIDLKVREEELKRIEEKKKEQIGEKSRICKK